jgi:hypothetical protein
MRCPLCDRRVDCQPTPSTRTTGTIFPLPNIPEMNMDVEEITARNIRNGTPENVARAYAIKEIADKALRDFEFIVDTEARAAADAVREKHRDVMREFKKAQREADQGVDAARIAHTQKDNRVGQRVVKKGYVRSSIWDRNQATQDIFGRFEMRTAETVFAANHRYLPNIGDIFIRLEKKDGTLGLKFDRAIRDWTIVE